MSRIILFNKPYGVLSQFTPTDRHAGLGSYLQMPGLYAAGRLDADSEGLLVLTDDGALQARIASPQAKTTKVYWVQVEGMPDRAALRRLEAGVDLGDFVTRRCKVRAIEPPDLWPRIPPIRARRQIPTAWIEVSLGEGKNRQVRRMTARVGFPTLRLIRVAVGPWQLGDLAPGAWREADSGTDVGGGRPLDRTRQPRCQPGAHRRR